ISKNCSHSVVESCVAFVLHPFFSWDIEPSRVKNSSRIELNAFFVKKFRRIRGKKYKTKKPISKNCSHSVVETCVAFVLHPFFSWDIEPSRGKNSSRIELNAFFVKKLGEFGPTNPSSKNLSPKTAPIRWWRHVLPLCCTHYFRGTSNPRVGKIALVSN